VVSLSAVALKDNVTSRLRLSKDGLLARLWPESGAVSLVPALDGLRGVAVLLVMVFHAWYYVPGLAQAIAGGEYQYAMNYLSTGVQLFFVLSGFLLFLPYARWLFGLQPRPSALLFYKRRALRVGPAYWVNLAILALAAPFALPMLGSLLAHAVFLHNIVSFPDYNFNPVHWTMAVEVQFYVTLPAIAWAIQALARRVTLAPAAAVVLGGLSLLSLACDYLSTHHQLTRIPLTATALVNRYGLPFWLSVFAAGIACSLVYTYLTQVAPPNPALLGRLRTWSPALFGGGVMLAGCIAVIPALHDLPSKSQVFGWLYAAMLLGVLFGPPLLRAPFESSALRFVGLISYSLYLWHVPVLSLIQPHLSAFAGVGSQTLAALALEVLIAVPLAYVSFQLTERPFFLARKRAHDPAQLGRAREGPAGAAAAAVGTLARVSSSRPSPARLGPDPDRDVRCSSDGASAPGRASAGLVQRPQRPVPARPEPYASRCITLDEEPSMVQPEGADVPAEADAKRAAATPLLLRAMREPRNVLLVLRSRWQLRKCTAIGRFPRVVGKVRVLNGGRISIGERPLLMGTLVPSEIVALLGGEVEIGDRVFINYGVSIAARQLVRIGNRCQIGNWSILMDDDFHQVESKDRPARPEPIILEDDVWLGARVIVLKGVTIGKGAVVGAGSVVTRDIPPRSVAVGVPARVVRTF
jgi:peptidoglycan/LPS O-acetylase OafA/YrhL/acetyltransferase-like isoleucine patch superfamily enzyme